MNTVKDETSIEALFDRFAKAFVLADVDGLTEVLAEGFEWRAPTGQCFVGREEAIAAIVERSKMADKPRFSGSSFEFFGDTVVQTYQVEAKAADGQIRKLDGCDVYRVRHGKIVLKDAYWKQLG